ISVNRFDKETVMTVLFPGNGVARESVAQYLSVIQSVYAQVAEGRGTTPPLRNAAQPVKQPA
ncbi:MAG TPA: acyltransferase, partial [Mycobacterium sp.]|nr:acyltransferase [Mycobacterium sp.]